MSHSLFTVARRVCLIALILRGSLLFGSLALKIQTAKSQAPTPEAILVLGGGTGREEAAAQLAIQHPHLDIWVSSGDHLPDRAYAIFQTAGVAEHRVYLDYRATDTVTNFTTLVSQFKQREIRHVYVVTSDFHMPRAKVIGTLVLGHESITFTPVTVPTQRDPEPWLKIVRDGGRSVLWLVTGYTGSRVGRYLHLYFRRLEPAKGEQVTEQTVFIELAQKNTFLLPND